MPAAAPVPRGPSVLTLYDAADLLTAPGCPVCRYAGEASDRHLGWFALEAHADAVTITRLAGSLGMCASHTRRLMAQPGAARRLTAVYRYIVVAARDRLAGRAAARAACPGCEHDQAATDRAMDTLLDGLADGPVRDRCLEQGGLCIPHLAEATARGQRQTATWLAETMAATLLAHPPGLEWLTGGAAQDADMRAVLRRAIPATARPGSYVCAACLAGVHAERERLARLADHGDEGGPTDPGLALCGTHLADAAVLAGRGRNLMLLLTWQANCHAARLSRHPAPHLRLSAGEPGSHQRRPGQVQQETPRQPRVG